MDGEDGPSARGARLCRRRQWMERMGRALGEPGCVDAIPDFHLGEPFGFSALSSSPSRTAGITPQAFTVLSVFTVMKQILAEHLLYTHPDTLRDIRENLALSLEILSLTWVWVKPICGESPAWMLRRRFRVPWPQCPHQQVTSIPVAPLDSVLSSCSAADDFCKWLWSLGHSGS